MSTQLIRRKCFSNTPNLPYFARHMDRTSSSRCLPPVRIVSDCNKRKRYLRFVEAQSRVKSRKTREVWGSMFPRVFPKLNRYQDW